MPIYGYACKGCGHTLDALQKIADDPLVDCPECGKPALKRQLSAPRFRLKGKGWYETDFKADNQRNLAGEKEAAASGKSDAEAGAAGKGDKESGAAGKSDKKDGTTDKKSDKKTDKTSPSKGDGGSSGSKASAA